MQYWKPAAENEFAGDMMPYWDGTRFHLFYLLDRDHHAEQGGLGGHQWAHASSENLVDWEHHPLAVPIGEPGSVDQHGICTGSIFEYDGAYHAYYATRIKRADGSHYEAICQAVSDDLIHFDKSPDNPMFAAVPGLNPADHRDPYVFRDAETGVFHMLVTAQKTPPPSGNALDCGILAHYTSTDLEHWEAQSPFLTPGDNPVPECPEIFQWNGLWYLVYSGSAQMEYRISEHPLGPWRRARRDTIESGRKFSVPRTAEFKNGRRIAVGFLAWRSSEKDDASSVYAGSVIFRELGQEADGTLTTRFVPEMMPNTGLPHLLSPEDGVLKGNVPLSSMDGVSIAQIAGTPADCVIRLRFSVEPNTGQYGLLLRVNEQMTEGYRLCFIPGEKRMILQRWPEGFTNPDAALYAVEGLEETVEIVVCMKGSIIDVCVNEQRTLVERFFERRGTNLGVLVRAGAVRIESLSIAPII